MSSAGETIMPFGKHKGSQLRDIPVGYLDWALGMDNLKPQLREAIESYLKTQAEYHGDWKDDREDYDPDEDD